MSKRSVFFISGLFVITTLVGMDTFDWLFLSIPEKETKPLPVNVLDHDIIGRYKKLHKQLFNLKIPKQKAVVKSKKNHPSKGRQLLNRCFNQLTWLLQDVNQKVKSPDNNSSSNPMIWPKIIKDRNIFVAAVSVASLSMIAFHLETLRNKAYEWELLHRDKTDEEILQDFETIMQPGATYFARIKELRIRRAAERLVDWGKEIYLTLFERIFFYAEDPIVRTYIRQYHIYSYIMDKAIITSNWKVIRRLLEPDLYNAVKEIFQVSKCGSKFSYYDLSLFHDHYCPHFNSLTIPIFVLVQHVDHFKNPDVAHLIHVLRPTEHRHFLDKFIESVRIINLNRENGRVAYHLQLPKNNCATFIKYIKYIILKVKDKKVLNACLERSDEILCKGDLLAEYYHQVQKILLSFGANPDVNMYHHSDNIVNALVDNLKLCFLYGAEPPAGKSKFLPNVIEKIGEEKIFRTYFFDHSDLEQKNYTELFSQLIVRCPQSAGWWLLRVLRLRLGMKFRIVERNFPPEYDIFFDKVFGYNIDKKKRSIIIIDPTLHDVKHIPQFCLEQLFAILSPSWRPTPEAQKDIDDRIITLDQETKRALLQWKKLFCFLYKRLPNAFAHKQKELGELMRKIVEQGYSQKPKTYEFLQSIIDRCLDNDTLPDIAVQNGVEGSMLHILVRFDDKTLKKIIDVYTRRNPFMLSITLSSNIEHNYFKSETSTPKHVLEQQLNMYEDEFPGSVHIPEKSRWNELKESFSNVLPKKVVMAKRIKEILPDPATMKHRAIAHNPFV